MSIRARGLWLSLTLAATLYCHRAPTTVEGFSGCYSFVWREGEASLGFLQRIDSAYLDHRVLPGNPLEVPRRHGLLPALAVLDTAPQEGYDFIWPATNWYSTHPTAFWVLAPPDSITITIRGAVDIVQLRAGFEDGVLRGIGSAFYMLDPSASDIPPEGLAPIRTAEFEAWPFTCPHRLGNQSPGYPP